MEWVYDSNQLQLWVLYKTVQGIHPYLGPIFVPTGWERGDLEPSLNNSLLRCQDVAGSKTHSKHGVFKGHETRLGRGVHQGITFLSKEYLVQVELVDVRSQNAARIVETKSWAPLPSLDVSVVAVRFYMSFIVCIPLRLKRIVEDEWRRHWHSRETQPSPDQSTAPLSLS